MESIIWQIFICLIIILLLFVAVVIVPQSVMFKKATCLSVTGSPVSLVCHIKYNNNWSLEKIRQIEVDIQFKLMEPDKLHVCLYVPEMKTPNIWDPVFFADEEGCFSSVEMIYSHWKWHGILR